MPGNENFMLTIFILLVAFQLKHFLCDYPLQTPEMLKKGHPKPEVWVPALLQHAAMHSVGSAFVIALGLILVGRFTDPAAQFLPLLALMDLFAHFTVDRIKASPRLGGRWNPAQPKFWWALGGDQMAHHLTHYFIIWKIVS